MIIRALPLNKNLVPVLGWTDLIEDDWFVWQFPPVVIAVITHVLVAVDGINETVELGITGYSGRFYALPIRLDNCSGLRIRTHLNKKMEPPAGLESVIPGSTTQCSYL